MTNFNDSKTNESLRKTETVKLGNEEVKLDPAILLFNEATINSFLEKYASLYDDYVKSHSKAQYLHSKLKDKYEEMVAEKIVFFKESSGCSDKTAEAKAKTDDDVKKALQDVRVSKHTESRINGFLRSMDRAHSDAMQLCYNLRKELDKLFSTVKYKRDFD